VHNSFGSLEGYVDMSQNYLDVCNSQNKILAPVEIREFRSTAFSDINGKVLKIYITILSSIQCRDKLDLRAISGGYRATNATIA
jgi:hypothetical protein